LGSGGIVLRIPNLDIRYTWVFSFTSRPLYSRGKSPPSPVPIAMELRCAPEPVWTWW